MKKYLTIGIISAIIFASFFIFSSRFYPILNSDDAVTILMTRWFHLPEDLYFWGQDRYGSIIPMIGQFFNKVLSLSPVVSESLSHYLILVLGFLAFSTLLKSNKGKIFLAVLWFFPPFHFIDLVRNVAGVQYSLVGILIFLVNFYHRPDLQKTPWQQWVVLVGITVSVVMLLWISDIAAASVFIIILVLIWFHRNERSNISSDFRRKEIYFLLSGVLLAGLFIWYARYHAVRIEDYHANPFNKFGGSLEACLQLKKSAIAILTFRSDNPFTGIYMYLVILLCLIIIRSYHKDFLPRNNRQWFLFFIAEGILIFLIILWSRWALLNGIPRRYFTGIYIVGWLAFLMILENYPVSIHKKILQIFTVITLMVGVFSSFYYFGFQRPKSLKPMVTVVGEFRSLGSIGLIAEYWNSYITAVPDPDRIKATPHDKDYVRNWKMVDSVFAQPHIYVIKDMWLDEFPDTLIQFDRILVSKGEAFFIGNCWVKEYMPCQNHHSFGAP